MMKPLEVLEVLVLAVAMVICGIGACFFSAFLLIELGLVLHGNYEIYTVDPRGVALCLVAGAIGLLAPGFIVSTRHLRFSSQFSLRTLLIVMTLIAFELGMIAWLDQSWIWE